MKQKLQRNEGDKRKERDKKEKKKERNKERHIERQKQRLPVDGKRDRNKKKEMNEKKEQTESMKETKGNKDRNRETLSRQIYKSITNTSVSKGKSGGG